ncbi:MAG: Snf7 family protein [Rhabdochlamydiaceae bacterium]
MSSFTSRWKAKDEERTLESFGSQIKSVFRSPEPLKPKLELATRQIQIQITRLNAASIKLRERETGIFNKVVLLVQKRDNQRANMLANELTEIRKMSKFVTQAKLAFEQIELRFNTIRDLGDVAAVLSPAVGIMRSLSPDLTNAIPEAQGEVSQISDLLSNILVDAGQLSSTSINFETANDEADKILAEASVVAENGMRDRFPDLPPSVLTDRYQETA